MIVAFDYHGAVAEIPGLRYLATELLANGNACHIISAIAESSHEAVVRRQLAEMGIEWTGINFVLFPGIPHPDGLVERRIGQMKADVMRQIGASVLFDDNPHIVRAVNESGLRAILVKGC